MVEFASFCFARPCIPLALFGVVTPWFKMRLVLFDEELDALGFTTEHLETEVDGSLG